jgi:1-acyl-sn-glycerol-3-phosphate acyltransferase
MLYPLVRFLGQLLGRPLGLRVSGGVLPEGGCVVVAGHFSYLDPLPLAAAFTRRLRFLGAATYFKLPIGHLYGLLGAVPIRRGEGDAEALAQVIALAKAGEAVCVLPEGTLRRKGPLARLLAHKDHHQPYPRRGAARIAIAAGVPVIPIGFRGPRRLARWQVRVGTAIDSAGKTPTELTAELWQAVLALERD